MQHRQARLRSGATERTCWVRTDVRQGNRVTLKNSEEPDRLWDVTWAGTSTRELSEINQGWNVGGIEPGSR